MTGIHHDNAEEKLGREVTNAEYDAIRSMFIRHLQTEMVGQLDLDATMETLTDDCVYELVQTGERWQGHDGARRFYEAFFAAFPEPSFEVHDVVCGPQGIAGIATMTAHMERPFAGVDESGGDVRWRLINYFSWDPDEKKIAGETLYYFGPEAGYFRQPRDGGPTP